MKKVEPGAVGRQATWKRRRDDLPKVHSTEKETDRYGGSTCNYRPSRVRRFGGSFYTTSGSGGISTARGATIALHRLICTQLTFPILARYLSEASVEVHDADELAETIR
jgi:hypothetical protein